jgi:hypothetical protein
MKKIHEYLKRQEPSIVRNHMETSRPAFLEKGGKVETVEDNREDGGCEGQACEAVRNFLCFFL